MTAAAVDVGQLTPGDVDPLWQHTPGVWLVNAAVLASIALVTIILTPASIKRLDPQRRAQPRSASGGSGRDAQGSAPDGCSQGTLAIIGAIASYLINQLGGGWRWRLAAVIAAISLAAGTALVSYHLSCGIQ